MIFHAILIFVLTPIGIDQLHMLNSFSQFWMKKSACLKFYPENYQLHYIN